MQTYITLTRRIIIILLHLSLPSCNHNQRNEEIKSKISKLISQKLENKKVVIVSETDCLECTRQKILMFSKKNKGNNLFGIIYCRPNSNIHKEYTKETPYIPIKWYKIHENYLLILIKKKTPFVIEFNSKGEIKNIEN